MAHLWGRSGPLEDVLHAAWKLGLEPAKTTLADVEGFGRRVEADHRNARAAATVAVTAETEALEAAVRDHERSVPALRARIDEEYAAYLQRVADEVARLQVQVDEGRVEARQSVNDEIQALERAVVEGRSVDASDRARIQEQSRVRMREVRDALRRAEARLGILRPLLAWFPRCIARERIGACRSRRDLARAAIHARRAQRSARLGFLRREFDVEVERRATPRQSNLDAYRRTSVEAGSSWKDREHRAISDRGQSLVDQLSVARTGAEQRISQRVSTQEHRLRAVQELLRSKEMVGARAEVKVAEELRQLPDDFHVLNHVRLLAPSMRRPGASSR